MSTTGKHPTFIDDLLNPPAQEPTAPPLPPAAQPAPPPPDPPKNKGGRPKGSGKNQRAAQGQGQAPPEQPRTLTIEEELAKLRTDYTHTPPPPPGAPGTPQPGQPAPGAPQPGAAGTPFLITGHLALIVVDALIPTGMAFALNKYGWNVKRGDLSLTEQERKDIEPIMDAVVRDMTADPKILLLLALVGAYASKIPDRPAKNDRDRTKALEGQLKEALDQLKKLQKTA